MSKRRTEHNLNEQYEIVMRIRNEDGSQYLLARAEEMSDTTLRNWLRGYQAGAVVCLKDLKDGEIIRMKLNTQAVEHYLNTSSGLDSTCFQFNISSNSVLRQ